MAASVTMQFIGGAWVAVDNTQDPTKGCFAHTHSDPTNPAAQPTHSCQEWECAGECQKSMVILEANEQGNPTKIQYLCTCS